MKFPSTDWQSFQEWADVNKWTREEAMNVVFSDNRIEWNGLLKPAFVRYVPDEPVKEKWVKISKSDQ